MHVMNVVNIMNGKIYDNLLAIDFHATQFAFQVIRIVYNLICNL